MVKASFATTGIAAVVVAGAQGAGCVMSGEDGFSGPSQDAGPRDAPPFDGEVPLAEFDTVPCDDYNYDFSQLARETNFDYVDFRTQGYPLPSDAGDAGTYPIAIRGSGGTACATADDPAKCKTDLDAVSPIGGVAISQPPGPFREGFGGIDGAFAHTKGDQVSAVRTSSEIAAFLGNIDSKTKAWVAAYVAQYNVSCSDPVVRAVPDGFEIITQEEINDCPFQYRRLLLHVGRDGAITVVRQEDLPPAGGCAGRRPHGLEPMAPGGEDDALGRYFAHTAYLEAASIAAFEVLREELASHGAPRSLRRRAARAARDEVRHARMTARMARRFGARVAAPVVARSEVRSLEEMALENEVEGCVRETFAALLATHQAEHAKDPGIAAVMRIIAQDETRHAALAWDVAEWLDERLSPDARARVRQARNVAVQQIMLEAALPVERALEAQAGYPSSHESVRLASGLLAALWEGRNEA